MIDLTNVADYLGSLFNSEQYNPEGLIFNVTADVNVYDTAKQATASNLVIPGLVLGGTGSYEPLQGVMVYSMPVNITFWGFACPPEDGLAFTVEAQKQVISSVVEALNGTTQTFGGDAVLFTGATVTVGNPTNSNGGGYTRLPILVQVVLTVVENAVMSNDEQVLLDGFALPFVDFVVEKQKTGTSQTIIGTTEGGTLNSQQTRVFNGTCYLTEYTPSETGTPASAMEVLENELLNSVSQNAVHSLVYRGRTYNVTFQSIGESLRIGTIVVVSFSLAEFPSQFVSMEQGG